MNDGTGNYPTLAVALSPTHWYSWCSERLIKENPLNDLLTECESKITDVDRLIPIGEDFENARLIIGHNVGFDRSFIREQYNIRNDKLKFLDTLSMHVSLSGLTGYQRALFFSYKSALRNNESNSSIVNRFTSDGHPDPSLWTNSGSLNSLKDVYKFHCGKELRKEARDIFVKGNLNDVRTNFQELVQYCALDTFATYEVFKAIWKRYNEKFPHPISLAGTLEMSSTYLPVNINNWTRYLDSSQQTYDDLQRELSLCLRQTVNDACRTYFKNENHKNHPWLWNLDWSTTEVKISKAKPPSARSKKEQQLNSSSNLEKNDKENCQPPVYQLNKQSFLYPYFTKFDEDEQQSNKFEREFLDNLKPTKTQKSSYLVGYPKWYRELCENPFSSRKDLDLDEWQPGPCLASTQIRNVSKLLNLTWKGFALHYQTNESWGYLVPNDLESTEKFIDGFPYQEYVKLLKNKFNTKDSCDMELLNRNIEMYQKRSLNKPKGESTASNKQSLEKKIENGIEMFGCTFYRLPHKDGIEFKVGNPLSKGFMQHLQDGLLGSSSNENANKVLQLSKALSYWKNTGKRITSQMVCKLDEEQKFGALLPRVVVAGTITRRAVEQTWLTASNAYEDRTGSELKAMIQAPDGYKFVGADVDSQELWIASLLGDSNFIKTHGCTALGWMTLQGTKSNGTDMHSKVASLIGITRDQAKILNYGRIYGAGRAFAARFLKQSNPGMSEEEAKKKAETIYLQTKGRKTSAISLFSKKNPFLKSDDQHCEDQLTQRTTKKWVGGSESHMFNMLEEIARQARPVTPVLNCSISTSLTNEQVKKDFITSVINWVVQSSGVDYLHLMLVSMDYLKRYYNLNGRFSISIHDEVRYLFKEEDQYKAAFALQVTNLLTRAIFCSKLGMFDVPMSVAFFSSVDIDTVIRKEVNLDCKTLSNPHGLRIGYNIPFGESLNMNQIMDRPEVKELFSKFKNESGLIDDHLLDSHLIG